MLGSVPKSVCSRLGLIGSLVCLSACDDTPSLPHTGFGLEADLVVPQAGGDLGHDARRRFDVAFDLGLDQSEDVRRVTDRDTESDLRFVAVDVAADVSATGLLGSGAVERTALTLRSLTQGTDPGVRLDLEAWALPDEAAEPALRFEGRLVLDGESTGGAFEDHVDTFRYTNARDSTRKHLPDFDFAFVQDGSHLIPTARGVQLGAHPEWEYVVEPGRVWLEDDDQGFHRASFAFALAQKNANCVHNGVMTFLFREDGTTSRLAYQISSETCLYFKFDMWGLLSADYLPGPIADAAGVIEDYRDERRGRLPIHSIDALASVHPNVDPARFGSSAEVDPDHMTVYGVVVDGQHYRGGCETRHGSYPFCDHVVLPSYSTAKSIFGGLGLMWLEERHPGVKDETIASHVSECVDHGGWADVTLEHALDMATGNYTSAFYLRDEGATHTNDLFLPLDHASKVDYACNQFDRRVAPGTEWVYHTSDTYLLGTAMQAALRAREGVGQDLFDRLADDIFEALELSPTALVSRRTYDALRQPFVGWGLFLHPSDVARLGQFVGGDRGVVAGNQVLDLALLDAALQRSSSDRGLEPQSGYRYNNGFWAKDIGAEVGCAGPLWVPFMSGYGGITVLLLPNGVVYYYFSDDEDFAWLEAARAADSIRSICN
jgi:hypothetical protein